MEVNYEIEEEFKCLICIDLLVEPVTTMCGHTFCKSCLIKYLKIKLNCPMCRKPILQSKDSLAKNVLFENLIKSKHHIKYQERLKVAKLLHDGELNSGEERKRFNIPAIILDDCYVWPGIKRKLIVTDMTYQHTITMSSINDRMLVIVPSLNNYFGVAGSLIEIQSVNVTENQIILDIAGLKRIKIENLKDANEEENNNISNLQQSLYVCSGEIIKDIEIDSQDIIAEVINKLREVEEIHSNILKSAPYSIVRQIDQIYGKTPNILNNINSNFNISQLESISFYYLNVIKNVDKKKFYITTNIYERVNWINEQYTFISKFVGNQSLPFEFYDLKISGTPKDHLKFTILLLLAIILFGIAYKYKYIKL